MEMNSFKAKEHGLVVNCDSTEAGHTGLDWEEAGCNLLDCNNTNCTLGGKRKGRGRSTETPRVCKESMQ